MYLKSLELQGFKSFPEKTVITFEPGVTAIVGANGSGKSNISDAIRWVLGEMSSKSLRGYKMEDVIFKGSDKRRPASFAEVIITIDNSDGLMKIDYPEISVGRRLYRSGESEYFLDKKQVRLKDIVDLFLNTGIGKEGYSIVGQGKIAEIISLKGDERREIFEEAAGISRFRYRKTEAKNKLVQTTENSLRIFDILQEVENRIPPLERQSKKAAKYMEIFDEKKFLELAVWSNRIKTLEKETKESKEEYELQSRNLDSVSSKLNSVDARIDTLYTLTQQENINAEKYRNEINSLRTRQSDISGLISVMENDIYHYNEQIEASKKEKEVLTDLINDISKRKSENSVLLFDAQKQYESVQNEYEKKKKELEFSENAILSSKEKIDSLSEKIETLTKKQQLISLSQSEKGGFDKAEEERKIQINLQLQKLNTELSEVSQKVLFLNKAKEELLINEAKIKIEQDEIIEKKLYAEKKIQTSRDEIQRCKIEIFTLEEKKETLEKMERLLEGFSGSVKEIMNASKNERLSGIIGPVSTIISTEEKYACAIETALGAAMQNIVTSDETAAKSAINYLKTNNLGRATFLPLTTIKPSSDYNFSKAKGLLGVCSDFVKYDPKYKNIVSWLLGRTLVCETIDDASVIAKLNQNKVRIVTLDGQLINVGGSYTGGQAIKKSGIITRNLDIKALEEKIDKLNDETHQHFETEKENTALLSQIVEKLEANISSISEITAELNTLDNNSAIINEKQGWLKNQITLLEEEINDILTKNTQREKSLHDSLLEEKNILNLLKEYNAQKASETLFVNEEDKKRILLFKESEELHNKLSEKIALLQTYKTNALSFDSSVNEKRSEIERHDNKITFNTRAINDSEEKIKENIKEKESLLEELSLVSDKLEKSKQCCDSLEKETVEKRAEQKNLSASKEVLAATCLNLKNKYDDLSGEKQTITEKLFEEYEMQIDDPEFSEIPSERASELGGEERLTTLRLELKKLGPVNIDSLQELKETKERYEFLKTQYNDIQSAKESLEKLIISLENTMKDMFKDTFDKINRAFKETFQELFGGGNAEITLSDEDDLLNCGIDINISLPGKQINNLSLLSGGEQAFVAIALYFALLKVNPTPFCIFDEIETALDEANILKLGEYLKKNCKSTQYIVITHRRGTMEAANVLYGITMQEKGVSDFLKLDTSNFAYTQEIIEN